MISNKMMTNFYMLGSRVENWIFRYVYGTCDAILPRKGPITRTMSKRLQEDWARAAEEGPRVLMNLRVDF